MKTLYVILYVGLLWLRWMASSLPGYVHPDEYCQSPEITAGSVFNIETFTPWEYQPQHAARSIVIPYLVTGIPFCLLRFIEAVTGTWHEVPETLVIFLVQRTACFLFSILIDYSVISVCRYLKQGIVLPLFLVATSQVMLVYYIRPFSNSAEAIILGLSLVVYTKLWQKPSAASAFLLGSLLSLGVFTRITFLLYGLAVGLGFLWLAYQNFSRNGLRLVQAFLFGGLTVAAFCVVADSLYYGSLKLTAGSVHMDTLHKLLDFILHPSQWTQLAYEGTLSWTPLNNLLYNLKTENLAQHGIHPRYVHLLVNLPMLFGPLAFVFAAKFISMIKGAKNDAQAPIIYVLLGIVGISMAGLSLMPHQEARFLAPMLVPLVLLVAWHQRRLPVAFWLLWVVFNIATLYIFGVLHQGGIVPAMAYLQGQVTKVGNCHLLDSSHLTCQLGLSTNDIRDAELDITTHLVFYKTYMPPQHLLGYPKSWRGTHAMQVQLVDCLGNETCAAETLRQRSGVKLRTDRQFYEIDFAQSTISDAYERTLLIAPNIEPPPQVDGHRYLLLGNYVPHVDFENISIRLVKEGRWKMKLVTPPPSLNVYLLISEE